MPHRNFFAAHGKKLALLLAVVLLLTATLGGTLAYVVIRTPSLRNTFTYAPLKEDQVFIDITKHMDGEAYPLSGFTFELLGEDGAAVAVSDPTDANGKTCLKLTYDLWTADRTYRYTLREVNSGIAGMAYDQTVQTFAVSVTKDESGTVYANFTDPTAQAEPEPTETVPAPAETEPVPTQTEPLPAGTELPSPETEPLPAETVSAPTETGSVPAETAPAQTDPVPAQTGPAPTETVPAPAEAEPASLGKTLEVSFTNTYEPKHIHGLKTLDGAAPGDHAFTFALYESDSTFGVSGQPIQTVTNNDQGVFDFDLIDYPGPGTYYYAVVEDTTTRLANIVYDETVFGVAVQVGTDGEMTMRIFHNGGEAEMIRFENETVSVPPVTEPVPTDPIPTSPPETTPPTGPQPPETTAPTQAPTEAATDPTQPATPGTSPSTGDDSNIGLWSAVMCATALGLTALLAEHKKRESAKPNPGWNRYGR